MAEKIVETAARTPAIDGRPEHPLMYRGERATRADSRPTRLSGCQRVGSHGSSLLVESWSFDAGRTPFLGALVLSSSLPIDARRLRTTLSSPRASASLRRRCNSPIIPSWEVAILPVPLERSRGWLLGSQRTGGGLASERS